MAFLSAPLLESLAMVAFMVVAFTLLALGESLGAVSAVLGMFAVSFVRLRANLAGMLGAYTNLSFSLASVDVVVAHMEDVPAPTKAREPHSRIEWHRAIQLKGIHFIKRRSRGCLPTLELRSPTNTSFPSEFKG